MNHIKIKLKERLKNFRVIARVVELQAKNEGEPRVNFPKIFTAFSVL